MTDEETKAYHAGFRELIDALEAMHDGFASNFPDGESTAVDMARSVLRKLGKK
jgi:hypothetical protein